MYRTPTRTPTSTTPPPPPPPPPPPVEVSNTMTLGTTTTAATAAIPSPQVQVPRTEAVGTSAIVSEAVGTSVTVSSIPTRTSTTPPVTTTVFTPSHPKYRATLQTYVGERQERPQFLLSQGEALLPEEEAQNWGFRAGQGSHASTPRMFEVDDDVSSVKSRSIKSQEGEDPYPGLSFEDRKKMETDEAKTFYQRQMNKMSPKTKDFQKHLHALNQVLKRKCPPMELAFQIMGDLTQTWSDIKFHRKVALSKMSHWTKENDPYLIPKEQMYQEAQESYYNLFLYHESRREKEKKVDDELEMGFTDGSNNVQFQGEGRNLYTESKMYHCDQCATPGFQSLQELRQHQYLHQPTPLQHQDSARESASPQMRLAFMNAGATSQPTPLQPQPPAQVRFASRNAEMNRNDGFQYEPSQENPLDQRGYAWEEEQRQDQMRGAFRPVVPQPTSTTAVPLSNNNILSAFDPMWQQQGPPSVKPFQNPGPLLNSHPQRNLGDNMFRRQIEEPRNSSQPQAQALDHEQLVRIQTEVLTRAFSEQMRLTEENRAREWERQEKFRHETARRQEELDFKKEAEQMCSIFNPDKWTNQTDKMSEFIHWLSEVEGMQDRMEELRFTGIKKYQMLRYRLEGQARQCTRIDFPNDESYERAMNLLKDRYYDKALAMREWYRKLKNVPKIPEDNHVKINQATTEILNLIEQLDNKKATVEEMKFLICAELIEPKLNRIGSETWEKIRNDKTNDDATLGHDMVNADLKNCLIIMKTKITNREFNRAMNKDDGKTSDDWKKKQELKKKDEERKKEEERRAKNNLYGQSTSNEASVKNKQPSNGKNTCPVNGCQASLNPKTKGHAFVLYCPVLKEMQQQDRWKFYKESGSTCMYCFSISHTFDQCPVKNKQPCEVKLTKGPNAGIPCGRKHNRLLHNSEYEYRYKKNKEQSSNQTSTQGEEGEDKTETDQ